MSTRLYAGPYCLIPHKAMDRYVHLVYPGAYGPGGTDYSREVGELTPQELDEMAQRYRAALARSFEVYPA